jgi:hypothetical protein
VEDRDVIVWKSGKHIAIINRAFGNSCGSLDLALWVVESSSDGNYTGLTVDQSNKYHIKKVTGDGFVVTRGLKSEASLHSVAGVLGGVEVYICSPFV